MNRQQKGEAYRAALTAAADSLARSRINSIAAEILDEYARLGGRLPVGMHGRLRPYAQ